jgi:hypothetical protein
VKSNWLTFSWYTFFTAKNLSRRLFNHFFLPIIKINLHERVNELLNKFSFFQIPREKRFFLICFHLHDMRGAFSHSHKKTYFLLPLYFFCSDYNFFVPIKNCGQCKDVDLLSIKIAFRIQLNKTSLNVSDPLLHFLTILENQFFKSFSVLSNDDDQLKQK